MAHWLDTLVYGAAVGVVLWCLAIALATYRQETTNHRRKPERRPPDGELRA